MRRITLFDGHTEAVVDDEDFERLNRYRWHLVKGYPARHDGDGKVYMHAEVLTPPEGMCIDHIDRDPLNNQRSNLRACSYAANMANSGKRRGATSSRFKGVYWSRAAGKWAANIKVNRRIRYLGVFTSEEDAARAYDVAAREAFGEHAHANLAPA